MGEGPEVGRKDRNYTAELITAPLRLYERASHVVIYRGKNSLIWGVGRIH
jgi:hypothetical protein